MFVGNVPQQLQVLAGANGIEIIYKDLSRHGNRGGTLRALKILNYDSNNSNSDNWSEGEIV